MTQEVHDDVFWSKVEKTKTCWNWLGCKDQYGYGLIKIKGVLVSTHRLSYELTKGKIPDNLQLDHICRNRTCVNPDHMEVVTNAENVLRGEGVGAKNARMTHCKNGHEFTPETTYYNKKQNQRFCKICASIRAKSKYDKKKEDSKI